MNDPLIIAVLVLLAVLLILAVILLLRRQRLDVSPLRAELEQLEKALERSERALTEAYTRGREESSASFREFRSESGAAAGELRRETGGLLKDFNDSILKAVTGVSAMQKKELESFAEQIGRLGEQTEQRLEKLRSVVDERLKRIQEDNDKQLERMRSTVDEKLQSTLEKRLGESFKLVSERLELVHKGLGEMQELASGVGDLKRVLSNVKTRGTWGEVQLGMLLEEMLSPEQYARNVRIKEDGREMVEFAVRLPGQGGGNDEPVWLPVDAKFPREDYERLVQAQEEADADAAEAAAKQLELRVRASAKEIREKYIHPPRSTDFAIMFLPTEGLYAEVIRRGDLAGSIQREQRVMVTGPTMLAALLNSLQMGFRTLAIQKRSSEVWELLGAVKREFEKFGDSLDGVKK